MSFRLLLWSCILLYLLPVWLARFLPMVDLPQHLALVNILRNYANPALDYARTYTLHLFPQHNVLHLFISYALSFLFGIEGANRIFLSAGIILLPLAMLHLLKTCGAPREFVFLSFPFIYNLNLLWGFVNAALAIPLVLLLLSLEIRWLQAPTKVEPRRPNTGFHPGPLIELSVLFILIFLAHSLMLLAAIVFYLAVLLARGGKRKGLALLPLVPVLFLALPWYAQSFTGSSTGLLSALFSGAAVADYLVRPLQFFANIGFRADDVSVFVYVLVIVAAFSVVIAQVARNRFRSLFRGGLLLPVILALVSLAGYLLFPGAVTQAWYLNQRLAVFCCLFLVLLAAVALRRLWGQRPQFPSWLLGSMLLVNLVSGGNTLYRFIAFDREARPLAQLLAPLDPDRRLVGLPYNLRTTPDLTGYEVFLHAGCYYQAFKRGHPAFSFASFPFSPVQYRESNRFLKPGYEWSPWYAVFPEGWQEYDYFLVHGKPRPPTSESLERLTLVASAGVWSLYARPDSLR